jgi:hypothetical protein
VVLTGRVGLDWIHVASVERPWGPNKQVGPTENQGFRLIETRCTGVKSRCHESRCHGTSLTTFQKAREKTGVTRPPCGRVAQRQDAATFRTQPPNIAQFLAIPSWWPGCEQNRSSSFRKQAILVTAALSVSWPSIGMLAPKRCKHGTLLARRARCVRVNKAKAVTENHTAQQRGIAL